MAKRKGKGKGFSLPGGGGVGSGMPGGLGMPGGMKGGLAGQLQAMQQQMMETQEALGEKTVEVSTGGGMVRVVMNGHYKLESITINPEVVDPDDVELLQDMVLAAINEAVEGAQKLAEEDMGAITGGLNIPGLF
jgi:hypothetical protein